MAEGLKFQHRDVVEGFEDDFSPMLEDERVRWDKILVEEDRPSRHLDVEEDVRLEREVDIALVNGTEAYVLEVKTTRNGEGKAKKQVDDIVEFLEDLGYDVWGSVYIEERDEHMNSAELAREIHERFGGVFDKDDLDSMIEYQNTWGSFGYIRSSVSRDLTEVDPYRQFHVESCPYDLELLEDRGVLESEAGRVFRFTEEYRDLIEDGEEEFTFMLEPRAYEKFDIE
ncbi:MAG: hypothetical protein ABEJ36_02805 [Candidatus Nanosalina sp.]